jgi:hypothetical protein
VIILYVMGVLIALAAAAVVGASAWLLRRVNLGQRRERWQDQVVNAAGSLFNALFLASFALSVVISWQAYDRATADVAAEASALSGLYTDVTDLPDGGQLHREVTDYARTVVDQEWPLLSAGGSSAAADAGLRAMAEQILAVPTTQDAAQAARQEAIKQLDAVSTARDLRLQDAVTSLPAGLLVCLLITAAAVLGHGLLVGSPHSLSSGITLLIEGALVAAAVFVIFVIRRPYHGAFEISPDVIRLALSRFTPAG